MEKKHHVFFAQIWIVVTQFIMRTYECQYQWTWNLKQPSLGNMYESVTIKSYTIIIHYIAHFHQPSWLHDFARQRLSWEFMRMPGLAGCHTRLASSQPPGGALGHQFTQQLGFAATHLLQNDKSCWQIWQIWKGDLNITIDYLMLHKII